MPIAPKMLSEVQLPLSKDSVGGSEGTPEQVFAGAAISRGRVFFVSSDAVYAFGPKQRKTLTGWAVDEPAVAGEGAPAYVQVTPTELVLTPGQTVKLTARAFDSRGRFLREEKATWSLDGLKGTVTDGAFTVSSDPVGAGRSHQGDRRRAHGRSASARRASDAVERDVRVAAPTGRVPPGWVNARRRAVGGRRRSTARRCCRRRRRTRSSSAAASFIGPVEWSNYTFEADVRSNTRRRMMADVGITAQRYSLVLYGTTQRLKLEPWEPETQRSVVVPFAWKPDAWYHLKLRVENLPNGAVRARGKAWPTGQPEPAAWQIDKTDPIGNRQGAPGFFIDAEFGAYIDNLKITQNE